ncbi:hypothetical protein PQX77_012636 [Marasmius sp. AFHP31]|nr:hypothetical protein PQX77_012636 [Marasmius sp. AFHP31]
MSNVRQNLGKPQQMAFPFSTRLQKFSKYGIRGDGVTICFSGLSTLRILSTVDEPQPEPELSVFSQFAKVDGGFLAWSFSLRDARDEEIAFISREFRGFGREIFTDTGQYFVTFGPRPELSDFNQEGTVAPRRQTVLRDLTLDERALVLALAVNIDFDYFSRHSGHHGYDLSCFVYRLALIP